MTRNYDSVLVLLIVAIMSFTVLMAGLAYGYGYEDFSDYKSLSEMFYNLMVGIGTTILIKLPL